MICIKTVMNTDLYKLTYQIGKRRFCNEGYESMPLSFYAVERYAKKYLRHILNYLRDNFSYLREVFFYASETNDFSGNAFFNFFNQLRRFSLCCPCKSEMTKTRVVNVYAGGGSMFLL